MQAALMKAIVVEFADVDEAVILLNVIDFAWFTRTSCQISTGVSSIFAFQCRHQFILSISKRQ